MTKATAIPFNEQVAIFRREVSKVFDYVAMDDFCRAKFAIYDDDWSPENIAEVLIEKEEEKWPQICGMLRVRDAKELGRN